MRFFSFNFRVLVLGVLLVLSGTFVSCSSSRKQASVDKKSVKTTSSTKKSTKPDGKPKSEKALLEMYATKMGVSASKLDSPKLYAVIDQWIGVPYKYGGNTQKGVDCSGFVIQAYRSFTSKAIPRSSAEMAKVIDSKSLTKLQEGDLVFFNYDGTNSHVGIYLQNGWFVHASTVKGVVLSDLKEVYYKKRFSKGGPLKIGRLKDLDK